MRFSAKPMPCQVNLSHNPFASQVPAGGAIGQYRAPGDCSRISWHRIGTASRYPATHPAQVEREALPGDASENTATCPVWNPVESDPDPVHGSTSGTRRATTLPRSRMGSRFATSKEAASSSSRARTTGCPSSTLGMPRWTRRRDRRPSTSRAWTQHGNSHRYDEGAV